MVAEAAGRSPGRSPGRRLLIVLLVVVGTVGLLAAGAMAVVTIMFGGGIDELLPRRRPTESSAEVVRARTKAEPAAVASVAALVDGPVREALGSALRAPGAPPSTENECTEGQHNWKIDDPYDLQCTIRVASLVVASSDGFRDQMLRLHERLVAGGWTAVPADRGIPEAITAYWDVNHGPFPSSPSQDDVYTQADLPTEQYERADDRTVRLHVDWTDRTDRQRPDAATIAESDYGVVLTFERMYFEG